MNLLNEKRVVVSAHLTLWLIAIALQVFYVNHKGLNVVRLYQWPVILAEILVFYAHLRILLPHYLDKNRITLYLIFLVALVVIPSFVASALMVMSYEPFREHEIEILGLKFIIQPSKLEGSPFEEWTRLMVFNKRIILNISFVLGFSFAYRYLHKSFQNEKEMVALRNLSLESELAFLNAQIDPHFLFNTLNSLFSLSLKGKKEDTRKGIDQLIELVKQLESRQQQSVTTVGDEIKQIENYMRLQSLRFSDSDALKITFEKDYFVEDFSLASNILMPLVENAYKYGISLEAPSEIQILLSGSASEFYFKVRNSDHSHTKQYASPGIGSKNIQKRLELLYADAQQMHTSKENGMFQVELRINKPLTDEK